MSVERRGTVLYPIFPDHTLMMSIRALERTTISAHRNRLTNMPRPGVRAATALGRDASTEVIDVHRLSQRSTSVIQYVEVADSKGRLYCVDGLVNASCWLKIVTLARDCQSSNVELMSTDKGVVLKTIKFIPPGEPLLMWFNQNLLAMMNMPFLTPSNIQGQNRYTCHICNNHFEYPNPLKIHLVLKCNRLDSNHLWNILAKAFVAPPRATLTLNLFPQNIEPFRFELSGSPQTSPTRISPIIVEALDSSASLTNNSPPSSNQASPTSSHGPSPNSSVQVSPILTTQVSPILTTQVSPILTRQVSPILTTQVSPILTTQVSPILTTQVSSILTTQVSPILATQVSPVRKNQNLVHRGSSAFKPYMNKPSAPPKSSSYHHTSHSIATRCGNDAIHSHTPYRHVVPSAPLRTDTHAAQMETIVSNLGKSKQGHLCIYCGKVYSRKYGLKIHIRTHTGYKPLKCKFCLRPFGDPSNLNKHVRLHADGETPYRCELCGKVLVRRRDLERHMRSRHQENAGHVSDVSSDGMDV